MKPVDIGNFVDYTLLETNQTCYLYDGMHEVYRKLTVQKIMNHPTKTTTKWFVTSIGVVVIDEPTQNRGLYKFFTMEEASKD